MADSMRVLRNLGVHDYHTQTERYNEYMGAAIVKGDHRAVKEFEERFKVLAQYGGPYVTLQDRLFNESQAHERAADEAGTGAGRPGKRPAAQVRGEPSPADRQASLPDPLAGGGHQRHQRTFCLSLLLIVVQENITKIRNSSWPVSSPSPLPD